VRDVSDRSVLVTGATRRAGIAAAVAQRLGRDGWNVATTGWRPFDATEPWGSVAQEAEEIVEELRTLGVRAAFQECDLGDPAEPARLMDWAEGAVGPLDALVVVHAHSRVGGLSETSVEEWDRHLDVNARGTLLVTFTSAAPLPGEVAYAASKGAIEWLTITAAAELAGRGITVNAVDPGPTDTGWLDADLTEVVRAESPLGRLGRPQDAAELVAFLLSPEGGWLTGQVLHSDGGFGSIRTLRHGRTPA
jgi:3-oxoacyl-[acyl-carrier protein] reductase